MQTTEEFHVWLRAHMTAIELGDDEFVEYVINILEEASMDNDEKSSCIGMLVAPFVAE